MANLLIGSSNVNRFYKSSDFPHLRQYKMVKCTQMPGFNAYMESLNSTSETVLISVVENFVVDAVGADVVEPNEAIDKCIKEFLTIILKAAIKQPKVKFGVVMPLQRPALAWYQERVELITTFMGEGLKAMISDKNINNVVSINCPTAISQHFDQDGIHLSKPSAKVFLEIILDEAERFFEADLVDLTENGELSEDESGHDAGQIKKLEERLAKLERSMRIQADKNIANDLMFARTREETDAGTNKVKED